MNVICKLDYDWKYACSTRAECSLKLTGTGDPVAALKKADRVITGETSSEYVSFVPHSINDVPIERDAEFKQFFWTTAACLAFLKKNPDAREFNLKGNIE